MAKVNATIYLSNIGDDICCPFFDRHGNLHAVLQNSGVIVRMDSATGKMQTIHNTSGQPSGAVFDSSGSIYAADFGHSAVLSIQPDGSQDPVVAIYEDRPFKGPHSIAVDKTGSVFFTDSGPVGETGLSSPTGSVFCIVNSPSGGQMLKPISLGNLAYPAGVAVDGKFIYVAEMMANRIIRYYEKPEGVYHGSVFYQFSGGVGPSCICCDALGNIYVGHYEIKESGQEGRVFEISKSGKLASMIQTPNAPEISGIAYWDNTIYITERSSGSVFRVEV